MKNKVKLIILLIPLILITSGCEATYKMNIASDNIEETLNITEDLEKTYKNAFLNEYGNLNNYIKCFSCLDNYIKKNKDDYVEKYYLNKDNFTRDNKNGEYNISNDLYTYTMSGKKNFSLKNNTLVNNISKDSLIINDDNIIIHLDGLPSELLKDIGKLDVKITTTLPVISNNADSVEENTYTWTYTKENSTNKNLTLNVEREKKDESTDQNKQNSNNGNSQKKSNPTLTLLIIIGIYIAIIIAVVNFFNKKKKLF